METPTPTEFNAPAELKTLSSSRMRESELWLITLARGIVALTFALLAISNPWMPLTRLMLFFAGYVLVDSALTLSTGILSRRWANTNIPIKRPYMLVVEGVFSAAIAIAALALPAVTPLRILGGIRGVVVGSSDLLWSRATKASDLIELAGITTIAFGLLLLAWPGPGSVALPWLLALPALVGGALLAAGALSRLRLLSESTEATAA